MFNNVHVDIVWSFYYGLNYVLCTMFVRFRGTSGIDIDLQKVDINQCPLPKGSTELNVFKDSHKCKTETTKVQNYIILNLPWLWLILSFALSTSIKTLGAVHYLAFHTFCRYLNDILI